MGTIVPGYGLITLLATIFVIPCCTGLRAHVRSVPSWLPVVLVAIVVLAFLLVPIGRRL